MPTNLIELKIFVASPSGLEIERKEILEEIDFHNEIAGEITNIKFKSAGWESTSSGMGRPQEKINKDLRQCDYCIIIFHDRWGSPSGRNNYGASVATEEEFYVAQECFENSDFHMKDIACYFKSIPSERLLNPEEQLKKVLEFKTKITEEKLLLYSQFDNLKLFQEKIRKLLTDWSIKNDKKTASSENSHSEELNEQIEKKQNEIYTDDNSGPESKITVENAWELANNGESSSAEIEFTKATINFPSDYTFLNLATFLETLGQLDKSVMIISQTLEKKNFDISDHNKIAAYMMKGNIQRIQGEHKEAMQSFKLSLKISEETSNKLGIVASNTGISNILLNNGDLNQSEKLLRKNLKILAEIDDQNGLEACYGNLGNIYRTKNNLTAAKEMFNLALDIAINIEDSKGQVLGLGNIAVINRLQGDIDSAEKNNSEALSISRKIGWKEQIASQLEKLSIIAKEKKELDKAIRLNRESLVINIEIGNLSGTSINYENLGVFYQILGKFDNAEKHFRKSLLIEERLKNKEGIASNMCNIGIILAKKNYLVTAKDFLERSSLLYKELGNLDKVDFIKNITMQIPT